MDLTTSHDIDSTMDTSPAQETRVNPPRAKGQEYSNTLLGPGQNVTNGQHMNIERHTNVSTNPQQKYERETDPRQANVFRIKSLNETMPANRFNGYLLSKAFQGEQIHTDSLRRLGSELLKVKVSNTPSKLSLMKMKQFQGIPIEVKIPQSQNTCQGIMFSEEAVYTEDDTDVEFCPRQEPQHC